VRIVHAGGQAGARSAEGTAVVIDVIRAFSTSAYALDAGAECCRLVADLEEAKRLAASIPGSVISAEVHGLPVQGVPISNSPTLALEADLEGRTLVQRTSSGTQAVVAAFDRADRVYAASLVVAAATVRALQRDAPEQVTLVASGLDLGHPEDSACARYIEALLHGDRPDLQKLLAPLRDSARYRDYVAGRWPGMPPSDLGYCLAADRFAFAMPASRDELGLKLTAQSL
jgi:2-phosphosulfolactate phosphatase